MDSKCQKLTILSSFLAKKPSYNQVAAAVNASMLTDESVLSGVSAKPFSTQFLFESVKI